VFIDGEQYYIEDDAVVQGESGYYMLAENARELDNGDIYHEDEVVYCEPDDTYFLPDDTMMALISEDCKDLCGTVYCTKVEGVWVHDEYADEYDQLINMEQLDLDIESKEEATVEVLAFINQAVRLNVPMSECVEVQGTWVHKDFQSEYTSKVAAWRTLSEFSQLNTWYN